MQAIFKKVKKFKEFIPVFEKYLENAEQKEIERIFLQCLRENNFDLAKVCLEYLDDINFGNSHKTVREYVESEKKFMNVCRPNPLIKMSYYGNLAAVKFLVENGANTEHLSSYGTTAIMYAFQEGHIDIVIYFLTKGAKIYSVDKRMIQYHQKQHLEKYLGLIEFYQSWIDSVRSLVLKNQLIAENSANNTDPKMVRLGEVNDDSDSSGSESSDDEPYIFSDEIPRQTFGEENYEKLDESDCEELDCKESEKTEQTNESDDSVNPHSQNFKEELNKILKMNLKKIRERNERFTTSYAIRVAFLGNSERPTTPDFTLDGSETKIRLPEI